ncbi:hypothetical protein [Nesterenkonia flava]|uniref:Uncharacterized protein n=1 Tax=Nesterenkonia flava TaxID=469799 RepID=A0ABU1FW92_9MICC|nr:hypothetical protein [Nesterenkonia flava]MDR5712956.1 hypothetical protein [Nesterenkonia flava]
MTQPQPPITHGRTPIHPNHRLGYERAEHLAALTTSIRTDWTEKGTITLIEPLNAYFTATDLAAALLLLAGNPKAETPKLLHHPGPHWAHLQTHTPTNDTDKRPSPPCPIPEHAQIGKLAVNCPACRKWQDFPPTITADVYQQLTPEVQHAIDRSPTTVVLD